MPPVSKHNPSVEVAIEGATFEQDVRRAVERSQRAYGALLDALPVYPRSAQELAASLGLDKNLAWKIFRLVGERDPLAAGRFIPGSQAVGIVLKAVEQQGVGAGASAAVREAAEEFERVVRTHAGDRASVEMMLSGAGEHADESTEIALRRAAFRSAGYFVGAQARTQFQAFLLAPSATPGKLDGVSVRGFVDLRRIRPGAPVVIGRSRCTEDGGVILPPVAVEPLDDGITVGAEVPLLRPFCSQPLPRFRRVMGEHGFVEDELVEGPVGRVGAVTCVLGEALRAMAPRHATPTETTMDLVAILRTPSEAVVVDYFVHESLFGPLQPQLAYYCDMAGLAMRRLQERQRYRHPVHERVERLGRGAAAVPTPDIPRYGRLLEYVFARLGWDPAGFDGYRARIEYPFVPASVVVSHPLPAGPG